MRPPSGIGEFHRAVLDLVGIHGCTVSCWIRTAEHNAAVDGAALSKHLPAFGGLAVDFDFLSGRSAGAHARLVADAHQLGLWASDEGDHVHVQAVAPGEAPPAAPDFTE